MLIDNENQFSTQGTAGQSLNGFAVGTTALANVIDSGPLGGQNTPSSNLGRDFGMGYPTWLYLLFIASLAPTTGTLDIQLVSSAAATLTTPNVMIDLTGGALAGTSSKFTAGNPYAFRVAMPRAGAYNATTNPNGWLRYIGLNFIVATSALTGGTVNAFITRDIQDNQLYAAGFTVS